MRLRILAVCSALALSAVACIQDEAGPAPQNTSIPEALRSLATPGAPRWRALADAPAARQEVAAARLGKLVYVAGGLTASGATDRVDVYDVDADSWTTGPPLPVKVHHAMAAAYGNAVVVAGGYDAANAPTDRVFLFAEGAWREGPRLNRPRAAGGVAVVQGRLLVAGGQSKGALAGPIEELVIGKDSSSWIDRPAIPTARHHVGAAADGPFLYVSGGRRPAAGGGADQNVAAFERFNVDTSLWEKLPNPPSLRSGHGSGFLDGRVVLVGGEDPARPGQPSIASTDAYDPKTGLWSTALPGMFRARHGVATVVLDRMMFVFLGGSRTGLAATVDSDVLVIP